jgi:hypothetical protein
LQLAEGEKTHRDEGRRASTLPVLRDGPAGDGEAKMSSLFCVWGYVSPESLIPLASALSAVVGGLLLLGNRLQTATNLFWRRLRNRRSVTSDPNGTEA